MDKLTAARVFVATVDRGSLSAAADALEMSRAMASRYVEGLETWLGARLLHRTTRRLTLTDAGDKALPSLRNMLELADEVQSQASQSGTDIKGALRVTSTASFAQAQLTPALVAFQAAYPQVQIALLVLDRPVNLVGERIDLGVRITSRVDEGLVARPLARCHSILCAADSYLDRQPPLQRVEDMRQHRMIVHEGLPMSAYLLRDLATGTSHALPLEGQLSTNETSVVHAAALAGAGIAMLPTYAVADDLAAGRLRRVLASYQLTPMDVHAVYASRRHQPRALRQLIDFLAARFGGEVAPWDQG